MEKKESKIILKFDGYETKNVNRIKIMSMVTTFLKTMEAEKILDKEDFEIMFKILNMENSNKIDYLLKKVVENTIREEN